EGDRGNDAREALIEHWLRGTNLGQSELTSIVQDGCGVSARWLNYYFAEGWSSGTPRRDLAADEPDVKGGGRTKLERYWNALRTAQYFYAAHERLQHRTARVLGRVTDRSFRGSGGRERRLIECTLRDASMLKVSHIETRKHLSRESERVVGEALDFWRFDELRKATDDLIEHCTRQLEQDYSRAHAYARIVTDAILIGIGLMAVFQVLLYIAEYARMVVASTESGVVDGFGWSPLPLFASRSLEAILIASIAVSVGMLFLYVAVHMIRRLR
ncbi:MAG: hypothetical protein K8E66_11075, partial [Phycisphaerales bacterium]|nr:hypothetical protein [Phycisphaerales bacterium]